jgi:hypothetical protein
MLIGNVCTNFPNSCSLFCADMSQWILDIFVFHLFIIQSEYMTIENKYRLSYISQQYWSSKVSSVSYKNAILVYLVSSSEW